MSSSMRRVCLTAQRRAARTLPKSSRYASTHAHDSHGDHGHGHHEAPHPWTYPKETFTSRPILYSVVAFVGLVGVNQAGLLEVGEKNPITRYMAARIDGRESILEENLERIEQVKEEAADYRLRMSAKLDTFRPMKNIGLLALGSPHGQAVKPREDISDFKSRPPRD